MARLAAAPITLNATQRQTLEANVRKRTSAQQLVTRAKIILAADAGEGVRETTRALGVTRKVVQGWRRRWLECAEVADVEARLADAPRPGAPATYGPEQICAIVALACEKPGSQGRAITHWTQQELADEAVKQGIVEAISQRSVGRFLKRSGLKTTPRTRVAE